MKGFFKKETRSAAANGVEQGEEKPVRLFVHIPKTAGTSFRTAAESFLGSSRVLRDYGPDSVATSQSIRQRIYEERDKYGISYAISSDNSALVAGHFPISRYCHSLGLRNTLAIFRHPIERVVSHYCHVVRDQDFAEDIVTFANMPQISNLQTRMTSGLDPALIGIVGVAENFKGTLAIVNDRWNWNLRFRRRNIGRKPFQRQYAVSGEELDEIARLNQLDQQLYDRARLVFDNSLYCLNHGVGCDVRGAISSVATNSKLRGWALDMLSDEAIDIEVFVNGNSRFVTRCTQFVPEIAEHKLPRNGYVGFVLPAASFEAGDLVEVRETENGLTLARALVSNQEHFSFKTTISDQRQGS